MGDLRDQLKKAKVLSDKRARQLAHEERVHAKKVGREAVEQEQRVRQQELAELQAEERAARRQTQEQLDAARRAEAERAACRDLLERDVVRPSARGGQRWYFELADGTLPWFQVDTAVGFQLQSGAYWVVRVGPTGSHNYALLAAEHAARVQKALPDVVVWAPGQ